MSAALQADSLSKAYGGVDAVATVSFAVSFGERLAVIGPNGAGKTTLFALLGGQKRPDRGRVVLLGRDVTRLRPQARASCGLGRTFQIPHSFVALTVLDAVRTSARLTAPREQADARAASLLTRLHLGPMKDAVIASLAYGDLRRLDLALALANHPRVLLMDEPVAGMARAERTALMTLVTAVADEENLCVVFTEHDMDVVFGSATRVIVMDRGRMIADGAPEDVRGDPAVRAGYLGER